jgi:hypothetical protein
VRRLSTRCITAARRARAFCAARSAGGMRMVRAIGALSSHLGSAMFGASELEERGVSVEAESSGFESTS